MRAAWLIVFGLAAVSGCKLFDDKRAPDPSIRAKEKPPAAEDKFVDETAPPWAKGGAVPAAGSWGDPRDKTFDHTGASKGVLAGYIVDTDGRNAKDVAISIIPADPKAGTEPIVILADRNGAFLVPNLKPGETYQLTAQMRDGGRMLTGQTYATAPSVHVRVRLKDDVTATVGAGPTLSSGGPPPPSFPTEKDRSTNLPTPTPYANGGSIAAPPLPGQSNDTGWSPTSAPLKTLAPGGGNVTVAPPLPAGETGGGPPIPAIVPNRPDLTTTTTQPEWRSPAASIPGPPPDPTPSPGRSGSNKPAIRNKFTLVDPMGRDREFPTQQPGTFVMLDFMTTTCIPCMKATPKIVEFQRQYGGKGLEVIGVACDPMAPGDRRAAAADYAKKHGVKNYLVYTEPGVQPGAVQKQFKIEAYPTLVLLDPWGTVLWSGHPDDLAQAARALDRASK
jgi:thiol-disulfide isomerase/thioredoxin